MELIALSSAGFASAKSASMIVRLSITRVENLNPGGSMMLISQKKENVRLIMNVQIEFESAMNSVR